MLAWVHELLCGKGGHSLFQIVFNWYFIIILALGLPHALINFFLGAGIEGEVFKFDCELRRKELFGCGDFSFWINNYRFWLKIWNLVLLSNESWGGLVWKGCMVIRGASELIFLVVMAARRDKLFKVFFIVEKFSFFLFGFSADATECAPVNNEKKKYLLSLSKC